MQPRYAIAALLIATLSITGCTTNTETQTSTTQATDQPVAAAQAPEAIAAAEPVINGFQPLPADKALTKIAFGSCLHQSRLQTIWDAVLAADPDLFIFAGDNVYADTEDMAVMRGVYSELAAKPGFSKLKATTPILATWDDHDYGVNDGGKDFPQKAKSQKAFLDFWGVPTDSSRRDREGIYHAVIVGPEGQRTQIILLDTRYHRDDLERIPQDQRTGGPYAEKDDPSVTMLGDRQWAWLAEELKKPADLRLIVSSIQVVANEHGWERWAALPWERDKLFQTIEDARAEGVIFLSGDRHHGEVSVCGGTGPYMSVDVTSSGLNQARGRTITEENHHRAGEAVGDNHFGLLTIDWTPEYPTVHIQLIDEQQRAQFDDTLDTKKLTFTYGEGDHHGRHSQSVANPE
ncbi:alkaline phosphatase D family protein [Mucisphaera sp.]|uniref:alkaline phosphatase D family protein n=1 Tax=Mucisphaera sp. TaxID=2913024 RepID=UPI003D0CE0E6